MVYEKDKAVFLEKLMYLRAASLVNNLNWIQYFQSKAIIAFITGCNVRPYRTYKYMTAIYFDYRISINDLPIVDAK